MNYNNLEYNYAMGNIPDMYYYQLNGKSAQENYRDQKQKRFNLKKKKFTIEDFIMGLVQACLQVALNEILDDLLPSK